MKTVYYYYVLAVLGAVFSLNSCESMESKEKVEERNREATTAYLSNMYGGLNCEVEKIDVYGTDTISAECFIRGMECALETFSDVASKKQMDFLMNMKRRLEGQPTIILYSFDVKYTTEFYPEDVMTERLYGLYNARSKEFVVDSEVFFFKDERIPKIYGEVICLKEELQK